MSNTFAIPDPLPDTGAPLPSSGPIDFGPNVLVFDPTMPSTALQAQVDTLYQMQRADQFGTQRYAILLKPGTYSPLNLQVGFYTTVHGLGAIPDATTFQGSVYVTAEWMSGNATDNFWRGVENLAIVPTNSNQTVMWATSQATWLRRIHLRGSIVLFDNTQYTPPGVNWSSGGFIADSIIDTQVTSGSQQQYLTRNTQLTKWQGQNWNMVFVGDLNPPSGTWPADKYTVIPNTPIIREKPYLTVDAKNNYSVVVPALRKASQGPSWTATGNTTPSNSIPLSKFYVAKPNVDTASSINLALQRGLHLLLTPAFALDPWRLHSFATYRRSQREYHRPRSRISHIATHWADASTHCRRRCRRHDRRITPRRGPGIVPESHAGRGTHRQKCGQ